jgi:preprotein translocase subunit SecE
MKAAKYISRVVAVALGVATLVMFFFGMAQVVSESLGTVDLAGYQLAFGSSLPGTDGSVTLYKSAYFTFTFIIAALTALFSVLSLKWWKKLSVASLVSGIVTVVMMLIFTCSSVGKYVDTRAISDVSALSYTSMFYVALALSIAFIVFMVAAILIADYVEVMASHGAKKTIIKRLFAFLREYKSEVRKVTWPDFKSVLKNTLVVLVMCVVVGVFIWLIDWGLSQLLNFVLHING